MLLVSLVWRNHMVYTLSAVCTNEQSQMTSLFIQTSTGLKGKQMQTLVISQCVSYLEIWILTVSQIGFRESAASKSQRSEYEIFLI